MGGLQAWLLNSAAGPLVFVLAGVDLALAALLVVLPTQVLLVALATLLLAHGAGLLGLALLFVAALAGTWAGDLTVYTLARRVPLGRHPWLSRGRIGRARTALRTRFTADPGPVLVGARFLPLGRIATVLLAGAVHLVERRWAARRLR